MLTYLKVQCINFQNFQTWMAVRDRFIIDTRVNFSTFWADIYLCNWKSPWMVLESEHDCTKSSSKKYFLYRFKVSYENTASVLHLLCWMGRHTNDIEDPYLRTQWKHCKQNLTEEFHIVRLLDAERQVFRDVPSSPKYISNKNGSTAISPLRARPPFINNVNGDEGHYNIPGSSPFSRPIVCIDPFNVDDPDVWRPPRDNVPIQFASRRPTKAGQIAAAAQARRMAAYSRTVEVRGLGLASRNKQQDHGHAVLVHTANPVAATKSNNTNKYNTAAATATTMNSSTNNNTNSTNNKDNNKCNTNNTNSATAHNNNINNINKCAAANNNLNPPSTNLSHVNTCSNNAVQAVANLPMGQRLTSTCAQALRKSLTRGPHLRADNRNPVSFWSLKVADDHVVIVIMIVAWCRLPMCSCELLNLTLMAKVSPNWTPGSW